MVFPPIQDNQWIYIALLYYYEMIVKNNIHFIFVWTTEWSTESPVFFFFFFFLGGVVLFLYETNGYVWCLC